MKLTTKFVFNMAWSKRKKALKQVQQQKQVLTKKWSLMGDFEIEIEGQKSSRELLFLFHEN